MSQSIGVLQMETNEVGGFVKKETTAGVAEKPDGSDALLLLDNNISPVSRLLRSRLSGQSLDPKIGNVIDVNVPVREQTYMMNPKIASPSNSNVLSVDLQSHAMLENFFGSYNATNGTYRPPPNSDSTETVTVYRQSSIGQTVSACLLYTSPSPRD